MHKELSKTQKARDARIRRVVGLVVATMLGAGLTVAVAVPIAESFQSHQCEPTYWGHDVRNSYVYPETTPQCLDGAWTVTTPRAAMHEDAYGFNCYMDGNGACGMLEVLDPSCMTDPDDGYTMCANGDVYYRDAAGGKLWPVKRDPR